VCVPPQYCTTCAYPGFAILVMDSTCGSKSSNPAKEYRAQMTGQPGWLFQRQSKLYTGECVMEFQALKKNTLVTLYKETHALISDKNASA
jgi:hypothetical protein